MKQFYSAVAALFLASQLTASLRAEPEQEGSRTDPQQMEERHEKMEGKMLEKLTKKLSLSDEQQKSVKAILDKQGEKVKSINKESMEKRKAIHAETDGEIEKLLNDDQKKQYDQWKTERKEHFQEHHGDSKK